MDVIPLSLCRYGVFVFSYILIFVSVWGLDHISSCRSLGTAFFLIESQMYTCVPSELGGFSSYLIRSHSLSHHLSSISGMFCQ